MLIHANVQADIPSTRVYKKEIKATGEILRISGRIEPGDAAVIQREMSHLNVVPSVVISSPGGDAVESLIIARQIRRRKASVVVDGYCLSACAQYIFVAGVKKVIRPNAIVGFHGTPTSMYQNLKNSPLSKKSRLFRKSAENEQQFYKQIGVDQVLLSLSVQALEPKCVVQIAHTSQDEVKHYGVVTAYSAYVPDKETLNLLGVNDISGELPHDQQQLVSLVSLLPFNREFSPRSVRVGSLIALKNYLASRGSPRLPICKYPLG